MRIGIMGGGQLGRMLGLAGIPLGVACRFLDPSPAPPAAVVGEHVCGPFEDYGTLGEFARGIDLVTFEFENLPVEAAEWLAERLPVFPPPAALAAGQERLSEKQLFERLGIPTPHFAPAATRRQFDDALRRVGLPAVAKTRRFGYDGKGQMVIRSDADAQNAWEKLGGLPLLIESMVPFDREVSILAVRGRNADLRFYPLVDNTHRDGMLRLSIAPAPGVTPDMQAQAENHARNIMQSLNYCGVLAIEFFVVAGQLLANEMAPRVHNSGHWTIEGAETSQFENHLRAIFGLPLGDPSMVGVAAMVNLIGTLPDSNQILRVPGVHLHLYGKSPRPNRKIGHITLRAPDAGTLAIRLDQILKAVPDGGSISDMND
jgi:5-(carboxyamino)imidazole ribonucleotide synthase